MPKKQIGIEGAVLWWCLMFSLAWPRAIHAASFATDMRGYDYASLGWAVLMSLLGGALRTIFTLATDTKIVPSFGREMLKDAIVAMIAGVLAYIGMEALRGYGMTSIASEVRFAVIVFAGWSRLAFFGWINKLGTKMSDAINDRVSSTINPDGRSPRWHGPDAPPPPNVPVEGGEEKVEDGEMPAAPQSPPAKGKPFKELQ